MTIDDHLSQIETLWSVVRRAHAPGKKNKDAASVADSAENHTTPAIQAAQRELLARYGPALHRYLQGALHDVSAADDVYQDFTVRFLNGNLSGADPERGRFRNFLKSVLYRMVVDYRRRENVRRGIPLDDRIVGPTLDDHPARQDETFNDAWRDEMLNRAWRQLDALEQQSGKPVSTLLRLRVEFPELKAAEFAETVSQRLGRTISRGNVRIMLHRSREAFAEALVEAVSQTMASADVESLQEELSDLQLLEYCRFVLPKN